MELNKKKITSFGGILAARRFTTKTRMLAQRSRADRQGKSQVSYRDQPRKTKAAKITHENTYQLEPDRKFSENKREIEETIRNILSEELPASYDADSCSKATKRISEAVKESVKRFHLRRYKIVCVVNIGEKNRQDFRCVSRCAWDPERDNYVSVDYQSKSLWCVVTVYGIYFE